MKTKKLVALFLSVLMLLSSASALAADKAQGRLQGARPQHRRTKGAVRQAGGYRFRNA